MKKLIIASIMVLGIMFCFSVFGWHKEITDGEHTGYITAVERTGLFFKTFRAYLKTDPQSSQEDAYCVVDSKVYSQLEQLSEQKIQVTVSYFSWLFPGVKSCNGENAIIFYVISTKDIEQRESNAKAVISAYEANDPGKQKEIVDIKENIAKIMGREATFSEIEQILQSTGKINLDIGNKNPLGI